MFDKEIQAEKNNNESIELQSFNSEDRDIIAADFHRFEGEEEDFVEVENMEAGDWLNLQQISSKPVVKEEIMFESMENSKLAENHIIICGMVENIWHFVQPLRAENCVDISPIVILHDQPPTQKQWQQL